VYPDAGTLEAARRLLGAELRWFLSVSLRIRTDLSIIAKVEEGRVAATPGGWCEHHREIVRHANLTIALCQATYVRRWLFDIPLRYLAA
jgi:hypothetical protein